MRYLIPVVVPFLLQLLAYVVVFVAASGGGSFMGLLAMPVALAAIPALLIVGIGGVRRGRPLGSLTLATLAIAIVPPILLLAFRFLVES